MRHITGVVSNLPTNQTKRELIIEVWEALDCESVGARELEQIQSALRDSFGDGAVDSPASIARTLADEGAVLRHPEVLNFDTQWREQSFTGLIEADGLNFLGLAEAAESIMKLERLRQDFEQKGEHQNLDRLRNLALKLKEETQNLARSLILQEILRLEAQEIVQWLTVWLQEPSLFEDWLSLRRSSPEFIQRFPH